MLQPTFSSVTFLGQDAEAPAIVAGALRLLGVEAQVNRPDDLAAAARLDSGDADLLVLCDPAAAVVTAARDQLDAAALPRWAIALLGSEAEPSTDWPAIPRDEWHPARIAADLRAAAALHRLRRENARLRGDLATYGSRIAHDLRTPLGGILTTTEMLREVLSDEHPSSVPLTDPILDSADGLVKLIERMSLFAKATASREPPQRVDMGVAFWNAFQRLESRLLNAGTTLKQPAQWPAVLGHASWLEYVWRNLLENAIQYAAKPAPIEAGWTTEGERHRFWLRSSGHLDPAKRATLFHPFNRMHEPAAPRTLGLSMVRRLVELDGGQCGFDDSTAGESCFYFHLPALSAVDGSTRPTARPA